jgi:hypothetical protein
MSENRAVRIATIAVWTLVGAIVLALLFVRAATPTAQITVPRTAGLPVVYEFTTDT